MQKTVKMTLKGKASRKRASGQNIYEFDKEINPSGFLTLSLGQVDRIFMNLIKKLTPAGILTLSLGHIHVYDLASISFTGPLVLWLTFFRIMSMKLEVS